MDNFGLKIIAIITMLIDHIGAVFLENGTVGYMISRCIGRLAFPIFCFLLVEGFFHTKNLKKYMIRLGIFCFISEVPFDLAFEGKAIEFQHQNVFFTLFIGLCTIAVLQKIEENKNINLFMSQFLKILSVTAGSVLSLVIKSDYQYMGIILITVFYLFRNQKNMLGVFVILVIMLLGGSDIEIIAAFSIILILLYNGKKGFGLKYAFYIFYPAHLLCLYLIKNFLC